MQYNSSYTVSQNASADAHIATLIAWQKQPAFMTGSSIFCILFFTQQCVQSLCMIALELQRCLLIAALHTDMAGSMLTRRYGTIRCRRVSSSQCMAAWVSSVIAATLLSCMRTPRSSVHSRTATRIMLSAELLELAVLCAAPRGV